MSTWEWFFAICFVVVVAAIGIPTGVMVAHAIVAMWVDLIKSVRWHWRYRRMR